jgi:hypothetical protein
MPRRKEEINESIIAKFSVVKENLTLNELLRRVQKEHNIKKKRSLEQKIIALKILQLNNMQYSLTGRQVGVTRKTLMLWWKQYGEMIKIVQPEHAVLEAVITDVVINQSNTIKKAYKVIDDSLDKIGILIEKARGTKSIYAISKALISISEIIKTINGIEKDGGGKANNYYTDIWNMMIKNAVNNGNNSKLVGDIPKRIEF